MHIHINMFYIIYVYLCMTNMYICMHAHISLLPDISQIGDPGQTGMLNSFLGTMTTYPA